MAGKRSENEAEATLGRQELGHQNSRERVMGDEHAVPDEKKLGVGGSYRRPSCGSEHTCHGALEQQNLG